MRRRTEGLQQVEFPVRELDALAIGCRKPAEVQVPPGEAIRAPSDSGAAHETGRAAYARFVRGSTLGRGAHMRAPCRSRLSVLLLKLMQELIRLVGCLCSLGVGELDGPRRARGRRGTAACRWLVTVALF